LKLFVLGFSLLMLSAIPSQAAFISFDDSNPFTITVTAGDFENGFFVNGNLLTTGIGDSASITLPDGGNSFSGSWIDLGFSDGSQHQILFALPSDPTAVTSGATYSATTDGNNGTITGTFGGFVGTPYFGSAGTFPQDGSTQFDSEPFLTISFTSETPTPEPSTMLLMGSLLPALFFVVRRRRA
jgi:hypothetical protein